MTASPRAIELTLIAAAAASEKFGTDIIAIDVSEKLPLTDVFLIVTASNDPLLKSICNEVEEKLRIAGSKIVRSEGLAEGRWALLDFSEIVVHVQNAEERIYYDLERLWRDCPTIDITRVLSEAR